MAQATVLPSNCWSKSGLSVVDSITFVKQLAGAGSVTDPKRGVTGKKKKKMKKKKTIMMRIMIMTMMMYPYK